MDEGEGSIKPLWWPFLAVFLGVIKGLFVHVTISITRYYICIYCNYTKPSKRKVIEITYLWKKYLKGYCLAFYAKQFSGIFYRSLILFTPWGSLGQIMQKRLFFFNKWHQLTIFSLYFHKLHQNILYLKPIWYENLKFLKKLKQDR